MDTEEGVLRERVWRAAGEFSKMPVPREIPETLPLLDSLRAWPEWRPRAHEGPVLFVQHQLGHFPARLSAAIEDGLAPARTWFLDIPYSTNREVYRWIARRFGANHLPDPLTNSLAPYCVTQAARLRTMLSRIAEAKVGAPLLVVDDGGYFVRYVSELLGTDPDRAEIYRGALIVEQTTRGHWALEAAANTGRLAALGIRAVSVARTRTKRIFEGPFIGASVAGRLAEVLAERRLTPSHALVIGFGTVGAACVRVLRSDHAGAASIDVLEKDDSKAASIRAAGCSPLKKLPEFDATRYDFVLGCTGGTSFKPTDRHLLEDHAILASGSSGSVEFNRENWVDEADSDQRDAFELQGDRAGMRKTIHSDMTFAFEGGRHLTILNAGFPLNFDGGLTRQPTAGIEPTHCLLHAAVAEVLRKESPGLYPLSAQIDDRLLKEAVAGLPTSRE